MQYIRLANMARISKKTGSGSEIEQTGWEQIGSNPNGIESIFIDSQYVSQTDSF